MKSTVLFLVLVLLVNFSNGYEDKTVAQWLTDNGFSTLVNLLKIANLYSVLDGPGEPSVVVSTLYLRNW